MAINAYGGMTLKALLENPDLLHAPAALSGVPSLKEKKGSNGAGDTGFSSAFLGPQLWGKTYDADFNIEYMDLDEFLFENGIPVNENHGINHMARSSSTSSPKQPISHESPGLRANPCVSPHPSSAQIMPPTPAHALAVPPVSHIAKCPEHFLFKVEKTEDSLQKQEVHAASPGTSPSSPTPPVSPLPVHVEFRLSEQDIALSSVPGQNVFDPTACIFTEDELKPQPMIKKSRKVFVPDEMKDDRYWARRRKNNCAAKRSRDARRVKENQIAMRAAYLEKENSTLKDEMEKIRRENARLKHRLSKYEPPNSCK